MKSQRKRQFLQGSSPEPGEAENGLPVKLEISRRPCLWAVPARVSWVGEEPPVIVACWAQLCLCKRQISLHCGWLCLVTSEHCTHVAHAHFKTKKREKGQIGPFATYLFSLLYSGESAMANNVRECVPWEEGPVPLFCADEVTVSHTSKHFLVMSNLPRWHHKRKISPLERSILRAIKWFQDMGHSIVLTAVYILLSSVTIPTSDTPLSRNATVSPHVVTMDATSKFILCA